MRKQRVIMLLSGGVDSSVSAALLKNQGYDVIGVYILGWTGTPEFPCGWQNEEADARKVADQLGIPYHTVNVSKEYETAVIDQFFAGYNRGITPNPDILCNREIKFKAVWQAVRQFEPSWLATGHYAKIIDGKIFKPADANKDQTYFLWGINKDILSHVLFPLGDLTKPQVRALAEKYHLPTAAKKDSQGICFVGPLKVRQFLSSRVTHQPGEAILTNGEIVANHDGVNLYTIGQRLGAGSVSWIGDVPPLFVLAKDQENNRLIVGPDVLTYTDEFEVGEINWLVANGRDVVKTAKIRYRQGDIAVSLEPTSHNLRVRTTEPVRAVTPGQSTVFYSAKGQLLGGGIITKSQTIETIINDSRARYTRQKATV